MEENDEPAIVFDRLDHVGAGVHDLYVAIPWWHYSFGFVREVDLEIPETGARGVILRRGDVRIELFDHPGHAPGPKRRRDVTDALREGGFHHIALQVAGVEVALAELQSRGVDVAFRLTTGPFGAYAIVADPSGNFVELFPRTDIRDANTFRRRS